MYDPEQGTLWVEEQWPTSAAVSNGLSLNVGAIANIIVQEDVLIHVLVQNYKCMCTGGHPNVPTIAKASIAVMHLQVDRTISFALRKGS